MVRVEEKRRIRRKEQWCVNAKTLTVHRLISLKKEGEKKEDEEKKIPFGSNVHRIFDRNV